MKLLLSLIQTSRPSSLPILITNKPETRHLTDKVYIYSNGKIHVNYSTWCEFFHLITGLIRTVLRLIREKRQLQDVQVKSRREIIEYLKIT